MLLPLLAALPALNDSPYQYRTEWTTANIDNFSAWGKTSGSGPLATFQQRYLINDTWWQPNNPIFLYTGNEGDITLFAANTGFLWETAAEFGALVVFVEHRCYGLTATQNPTDFCNDPTRFGYLSSEQALADYAYFVDSLKSNLTSPNSPVIAFGGSYGGMLSAWFRMKYPAYVAGAIAASAPILQFTGLTDPKVYNSIVTNTFARYNSAAPQAYYNAWEMMTNMSATQQGRDDIRSLLRICDSLESPSDVTNTLFNWLINALGYSAMGDYPTPANFLGPMPAWPVKQMTAAITDPFAPPEILLPQIRVTAEIFYNYTGQAGTCFNLTNLMPASLNSDGWNIQSAMEMVMPMGQYGLPNDMFPILPWSLPQYIQQQQAAYGTTPRPNMARVIYNADDLSSYSNIVFSNGLLDPWSGGGVLKNITGAPTLVSIQIAEGAHHLDLRPSSPQDPESVIIARNIERQNIRNWIDQHNEKVYMRQKEKILAQ